MVLVPGLTAGDIAQLMVGVAAIAALFLGPTLGFNNARRLAVASSRQAWLDGVRSDAARIIAVHGELVIHRAKQKRLANKAPDPPALMMELGELSARVRMRLNVEKEAQKNLNVAISQFISNDQSADPNGIIKAMDPIVDEVWSDIKAGKL